MADDGKPDEVKPSEGMPSSGSGQEPSSAPQLGEDDDEREEDGEEERRPITLDSFGRRRGSTVSWPHVVILVLMLATLLVLLTFKDRCGNVVSGFIFMTNARDRGAAPNVRIQMEPPPAPGTGSGSGVGK